MTINAINKSRRYKVLSDGSRVDVVGGGGAALFSDDFATGDLSKTENGVSWGNSAGISVVSNKLRFDWTYPSKVLSEQRYTLGATKYPELWIKYDLTIGAYYNHLTGNNKGPLMVWSNTSGSNTEDGYSQANELLVSVELWPNDAADGGSKAAIRVYGSGYDYNYGDNGAWQNVIALADRGQTRTFVVQVKLGTYAPADFSPTTAGDGVVRIWKDGVKVVNKTNANIFKPGFAGWNRGYFWGEWNSTSNTSQTTFDVDNVVISTTNIYGVS